MKNSRKALTVGSVVVIAVLGWLMGVVLSAPPYLSSDRVGASEMAQLRGDLSNYIADKFKKERINGTLVDIAVQSPVQQSNGSVEFPYILAYNEPVNGEETTSWIQATATLEKQKDSWHVVRVKTQKETVTYANAAVVVAGQE